MGRLIRQAFAISPKEVSFSHRGFPGVGRPAQEHLEAVACAFVDGYSAALEEAQIAPLAERLEGHSPELRGLAYEGAAMALALQGFLAPWRFNRLQRLLEGPGAPHAYLVHVGVGWALARFPVPPGLALARLDPLLGWLAWDGFGFHQGFFHHREALAGRAKPRRVRGYARRVFDQGLGRSLWFIFGANVADIAVAIDRLAPARHGDLWSGVGLACAYAGGIGRGEICQLRQAAADSLPWLAQGAAFAAKARARAGNLTSGTELACRILCGSTAEAVAVADAALEGLPDDGLEPAYATWRSRIAQHFAEQPEEVPFTTPPSAVRGISE